CSTFVMRANSPPEIRPRTRCALARAAQPLRECKRSDGLRVHRKACRAHVCDTNHMRRARSKARCVRSMGILPPTMATIVGSLQARKETPPASADARRGARAMQGGPLSELGKRARNHLHLVAEHLLGNRVEDRLALAKAPCAD